MEANEVSTAQCALREKLKILQDLSYICMDHELLRNATAVIHELAGKMKCSVPKEDLLPLLSNQDDIKLKLRVLPPQKRKGKVKAKKRRIEKRISGDTGNQSGSSKENLLTDCTTIGLPEAETLLAELIKYDIAEVESGVRLSVCGQMLESRDFKSLKHPHWLNDKVINAYLDTLTLENNTEANTGNFCFNISTYMPLLWERDQFDDWMFKKVYMTFFFLMNTVGVVLINILTHPSFIMAVNGINKFDFEAQESASIHHKCTPHRSGGLIKAFRN
ncbi:uncharacterized protein LOC125255832 [Megalobrama amblycephala]|nr:uncharacterized protein LOC125255832 [Megalobrama amblycephala]